jgi:hypothetical protein
MACTWDPFLKEYVLDCYIETAGVFYASQEDDHRYLFQMAILTNQACICHELALMDELDKLGDIFGYGEVVKGKDCDIRFRHLTILMGHVFAPAA